MELGSYGDYTAPRTVRWMYPHRSRQAARDEGAQTDERQRAALPSRQHSLADSMSGSAAAALAELENFGAYGKAPAPAEDEAPPPKRQRAPARSSASLLAEAEAELAESQVG